MKKTRQMSEKAFQLNGRMPLSQAIPLGLQHVLAMFVGNLTPLLIITGTCGIASGEFADLQLHLLQNAMLIAGVVMLVQLFSIGPIGGNVPIVMGTSSGFLGVFKRDIMWEVLFIFPVAMLGLWLGMESSKSMNDAIARKILLVC